ncbi:ankyrin repeat domain-containing protein [Campylobacter taeniopygiae]|uniref:ankyrin repeat domain-containing protein n=1 Tax=Campylobacter taeniopygiae TaxID=2510188 RepID=UPI001BB25E08|nr:ankyrin repeat domain-containing protein [Campylobacter taeniopygiae]
MTNEKIIPYEEFQENPMLQWFFNMGIKHSIKDKYYKEWQEYVKKVDLNTIYIVEDLEDKDKVYFYEKMTLAQHLFTRYDLYDDEFFEFVLQFICDKEYLSMLLAYSSILWEDKETDVELTKRVIKMLVDKGADINTFLYDKDGRYAPLLFKVLPSPEEIYIDKIIERKLELLHFLLELGANPEIKNSEGENLLHYALIEKLQTFANFILTNSKIKNIDEKIEYNKNSSYCGYNALLLAVYNCYSNVTKEIIKIGANVNISDDFGRSNLDLIENKSQTIKNYLLEAGAKSSLDLLGSEEKIEEYRQKTMKILKAHKEKSEEYAKKLKEDYLKLCQKNPHYFHFFEQKPNFQTLLAITYKQTRKNPMLKWFFDYDIKHSVKDEYYKEWQEYFSQNMENTYIIEALNGKDEFYPFSRVNMVQYLFIYYGSYDEEFFEFVLQFIHDKDLLNIFLSYISILWGDKNIDLEHTKNLVKLLISKGADINALVYDEDGDFCPLLFKTLPTRKERYFKEIRQHKFEILKFLLELGADPNLKNSTGENFLHAAIRVSMKDFINLILNSGKIKDINEKIEVNKQHRYYGCNALLLQARYNYYYYCDTIKKLIDAGSEVNIIDQLYTKTPLDYALNESPTIANYLIQAGAKTVLELLGSKEKVEEHKQQMEELERIHYQKGGEYSYKLKEDYLKLYNKNPKYFEILEELYSFKKPDISINPLIKYGF